eukprot:1469825-Rhodomonas_salina.7
MSGAAKQSFNEPSICVARKSLFVMTSIAEHRGCIKIPPAESDYCHIAATRCASPEAPLTHTTLPPRWLPRTKLLP